MTEPSDVVEMVRSAARPLLATDFDGTLSDIVDQPQSARPVPGAVGALGSLSSVGIEVAIVSGRPISFLAEVLTPVPDLQLVGQSGLERSSGGVRTVHPDAEASLPALQSALAEARRRRANGVDVEFKGFSFTLHYREVPDRAVDTDRLADEIAARHQLVVVPGKMSVEVRVPVEVDKGAAVRSLITDHDLVLFAGDDVVDLSAFHQLNAMTDLATVNIAVCSSETPSVVLDSADLLLESPLDFVALLDRLADSRPADVGSGSDTDG